MKESGMNAIRRIISLQEDEPLVPEGRLGMAPAEPVSTEYCIVMADIHAAL